MTDAPDLAALEAARDDAYAAWKAAWDRWAPAAGDLYVAYIEANHALLRAKSPHIIALIEPAPWTQPAPEQPHPEGVDETTYPPRRRRGDWLTD